MVLEVSDKPKRYIALEGNRRVAALRLLTNPAAMTGLDMPNGTQRAIEKLAKIFDKGDIEPIEACEVESRDEGRYWIELRHNGEDQGRGVVGWKPIVAARYRKKEPAIQAFDMVMDHGGFTEDEAEELRNGFSLTTLRRLVESKDVQAALGLSVEKGQLRTILPGGELIKPLKRIIQDISDKQVDSRSLNTTDKMLEDPRLLFEGGNRTRISVINFVGLTSDEARQSFVNQLQMSLFTWIKRNPSKSGRLYVLDEAQNFAPSQKATPCKESTVSLARRRENMVWV